MKSMAAMIGILLVPLAAGSWEPNLQVNESQEQLARKDGTTATQDHTTANPKTTRYRVKYLGGWETTPALKRGADLLVQLNPDALVITPRNDSRTLSIPFSAISWIDDETVAIEDLFDKWTEGWSESMSKGAAGDPMAAVLGLVVWGAGSVVLFPTKYLPDRKYLLWITWDDGETDRELLLQARNENDFYRLERALRRETGLGTIRDRIVLRDSTPNWTFSDPRWGDPSVLRVPCDAMPRSSAALFLPKDEWLLEFTPPAEVIGHAVFELPRPLQEASPIYPDFVRTLDLEGEVVLRAVVKKDGTVTHAEVVEGVYWVVDDSIRMAFEKWFFRPGRIGNQPVDVPAIARIPLGPLSYGRFAGLQSCGQAQPPR